MKKPVPNPSVIAAVNAHQSTRAFPPTPSVSTVHPPQPQPQPPVREITTNNAGVAFGSGSVDGATSIVSQVNGRAVQGHVYDSSGNRIL